jgi:hypothetical protein
VGEADPGFAGQYTHLSKIRTKALGTNITVALFSVTEPGAGIADILIMRRAGGNALLSLKPKPPALGRGAMERRPRVCYVAFANPGVPGMAARFG